ncbi:MAG: DNA primase [Bacteroidetes bacterium]|nr:DNA primase [Bacteroidota bacterium]MCL5738912.1 DNA primase [Bacteroidota bacterium]
MTRFNSDSVVETVRQATDIVDIISQYVRLQKRGKNYLGLCPFHTEKTPSFTVNREKGLYHCFGCGVGGNVFTFLTQYERISFGEALRQLAARANISLPSFSGGKQNEVDEVLEINNTAAGYYTDMLHSNEGAAALSYLREKRQFTDETIEKFKLGYAPDRWDGLLNFLRRKGINEKDAEKSGLILGRQDGSGYYDRFRARVMFPVHSPSGRIIAFGGRTLKEDEKAKYINSPETAAYTKGRTLFGIFQAKDVIIEKDAAILVEGYADLIALHQSGIKNAVASSGTALTAEQIQYISRYTQNVYLVYDADTAGQDATLRGSDILLEQGMNVYIVELPSGEDPDTFVLSRGNEEFMKLIRDAMNIVEFKASLLTRRADSSRNQISIIQSIVESLSKINDAIKVNLYVKDLANKFGLREESIYQELRRRKSSQHRIVGQSGGGIQKASSLRLATADRDLISLLLNVDESLFEVIANQIDKLEILNPISKEIIGKIIDARRSGNAPSAVIDELSTEEVRKSFAELAFAAPQRSKVWWEEIRPESETPNYLKWIAQLLISFELEQIEQELKLLNSKTTDAEKKSLPTDDFDQQYQELVNRKQILSQTYRDKELLEQYFDNLRNS